MEDFMIVKVSRELILQLAADELAYSKVLKDVAKSLDPELRHFENSCRAVAIDILKRMGVESDAKKD